jgi:hypothetical protein
MHGGIQVAYPINPKDIQDLKEAVRKCWISSPTNALKSILDKNRTLIQHIELRNEVIAQILSERNSANARVVLDFKEKQYPD